MRERSNAAGMALGYGVIANRQSWEFQYTGNDLLAGAEKQLAFRRARLAFWTSKKDEVMEEIRMSGIEITETIAAGLDKMTAAANYGTSMNGDMPQVSIKPELLRKLSECSQRIEAHKQAITGYAGWQQVLMANPAAQLQLTYDDWLYFFRKA